MGIYTVNVQWDKDRIGTLCAQEVSEKIKVATPPEFSGGVPNTWSPEHLYVASVNSCFMTTFLAIAENTKLPFESFSCDAEGLLEKVDGQYLMTKITLRATLKIADQTLYEKAARILTKSESACLISRSIKASVHLEYTIN